MRTAGTILRQFPPCTVRRPSTCRQPDFINAVARIRTVDAPQVLLEKLLDIESRLGRVRTEQQFGPRVVDLDLLLYEQVQVDTPHLTLPHPRMYLRRFVLEPLFELEGDWPAEIRRISLPDAGARSSSGDGAGKAPIRGGRRSGRRRYRVKYGHIDKLFLPASSCPRCRLSPPMSADHRSRRILSGMRPTGRCISVITTGC